MIHLRKIVLTVFGVISTVVGWGIWKEPKLDSDILASLMVNEIFRLAGDPFTIFGLALMLLGMYTLFVVLVGPWTLPYSVDELILPRKRKKPES